MLGGLGEVLWYNGGDSPAVVKAATALSLGWGRPKAALCYVVYCVSFSPAGATEAHVANRKPKGVGQSEGVERKSSTVF